MTVVALTAETTKAEITTVYTLANWFFSIGWQWNVFSNQDIELMTCWVYNLTLLIYEPPMCTVE